MPNPENHQNSQPKRDFVVNDNKVYLAQPFATYHSDVLTQDLDGDPRLVATAFMDIAVYQALIESNS